MDDQYALEIDWEVPDLPRLVGPFDTRDAATQWGETNIPNGTWSVRLLAHPYWEAR